VLAERAIPFSRREARLIDAATARGYDLIVGMDDYNIADLKRLVYPEDIPKIRKLLSFAGSSRDVADPWYTGDFNVTYEDVLAGCRALLEKI
jgi:protein-tyrosine phosphatase